MGGINVLKVVEITPNVNDFMTGALGDSLLQGKKTLFFAQIAQKLERVYSGVVSIAPVNTQCIATDWINDGRTHVMGNQF